MVHVEMDERVRSADHATRKLAPPHGILYNGGLDLGVITTIKPRIKQSLTLHQIDKVILELIYYIYINLSIVLFLENMSTLKRYYIYMKNSKF